MRGSKFLLVIFSLFVSVLSHAASFDKIVAVVNDSVITQSELDEQTEQVQQNLANKNVARPDRQTLRKQVLNHIIDLALQTELANKMGLEVNQEELNDAIENIVKRNNLTQNELRKSVAGQGLSWAKYKANLKKEILLSKLQRQMVAKEVSVSDEEVESYLKTHQAAIKKTYHLKDIVIPLPEAPSPEALAKAKETVKKLLAKLKAGADFSQEALENSSGQFALEGGDLGERTLAELPSLFSKAVLSMKAGDLKGPIRAPNGLHIIKLVNVKSNQKAQMVTLTNAEHILITTRNGVTPEKALTKIKALQKELAKGKSFAELAKKNSEDSNSAINGGKLGWLHKGEVVPEFEAAMNRLKVGQVSAPVKSQFGYHLIKVLARKQIDDSEAQQKITTKQNLYQAKFQEAVQNWLQQLRSNSYVKRMA